ncbi:transcriptional regulator [Massilia sp. erpn]|uniref:transcriptional regulator n=1 Tax=Massilia sp. erpn TaxID=2738142 RepID=UPI0021024D19|nr:transcriptional regulator [Massilia sp. erpn]
MNRLISDPAFCTPGAAADSDWFSFENYTVALRALPFFRYSEAVDAEAVELLARRVMAEGMWSTALPVEENTGYIMDGNHRLAVAHRLGLRQLPCIPLSYEDRRISVCHWSTGRPFAASEMERLAEQGVLLPYKTTRHRFAPTLPRLELPLELLRQPVP